MLRERFGIEPAAVTGPATDNLAGTQIIEEQGARQPPDLTDAQWDHGSSDGEIFAVMGGST